MAKKVQSSAPKPAVPKELPSLGVLPPHLRTEAVLSKLSNRFTFVREVASGKTGVVYLLRSESNPDLFYCLKTIKPDIADPKSRNAVKETLRKECEILSPLSHKCLPTIYEAELDADPPYYICTYHPGETFASFQEKRKHLTVTQAAFVIWSLIDVLKYLHGRRRSNSCDKDA
jgi:serine/threonine protein kinase